MVIRVVAIALALKKGRVAELAYPVTLASSPFRDTMFYELHGYDLAHTGNGHVKWMSDRIQGSIHRRSS